MAFHKKWSAILRFNPSIVIISECANPEALQKRCPDFKPTSIEWIGGNPNKGLMVATFGDYELKRHSDYNSNLKWILPMEVTGPKRFRLLAVWAKHEKTKESANSVGPTLQALKEYDKLLIDSDFVVAGDFNNNVQWDKSGKLLSHQAVVDRLAHRNLVSAYHHHAGEKFGEESKATIYWRDRKKRRIKVSH